MHKKFTNEDTIQESKRNNSPGCEIVKFVDWAYIQDLDYKSIAELSMARISFSVPFLELF